MLLEPDTAWGVEAVGEVLPRAALAATAVFQELVTYLAEHHPGHLAQAAVFGQAAGLPWPELPTSGNGLCVKEVRTDPNYAQPVSHPTKCPSARLARATGAQVRWASNGNPFCPEADALEEWEHRPAPPPPYRWGGLSKRMLGAGR